MIVEIAIDIGTFTQEQINAVPAAVHTLLWDATATEYQFKWDGAGTLFIVNVADDDKTDFKSILSQANVEAKMSAQDVESKIPRAPESGEKRIPIGGIILYPKSTLDGFLLSNGAEISREFYIDLFLVIGTTFGSGNGTTTCNLPNLPNLLSGLVSLYYLIKT